MTEPTKGLLLHERLQVMAEERAVFIDLARAAKSAIDAHAPYSEIGDGMFKLTCAYKELPEYIRGEVERTDETKDKNM